jgi:hypothetical protein
MSLFLILNRIVMFSWLLPVIFLIGHRQPAAFRWLLICQMMSFATEFFSVGLYYLKITPNYIINPMYVVSLIWISCFFYYAIAWKSLRSRIIIINVFFFLFGLVNILFIQRMSPNYYTMTIENLLILSFCILFYYKMLKDLPSIQVQRDPLFLIVSGWFFMSAGQVVLTLVSTYMLSILNDNMEVLWIMFLILNLLGNLIKAVGAYFQHKAMKASRKEPIRI